MFLAQLAPIVVTPDPTGSNTVDILFKFGKEFGVMAVIFIVLAYLFFYKALPALFAREKEKDEAISAERKHTFDVYVGQMKDLGDKFEQTATQLKFTNENMKVSNDQYKVSVDAFNSSLQLQRDHNKDVLFTIKDGHKSLTEDVAKTIKEDLSSIYRRIDELVKK